MRTLHLLASVAISMPLLDLRAETDRESPASTRIAERLTGSEWRGIQEAYEEGRHAFKPAENGRFVAENRGQQLRAVMDARGFTATAPGADWRWGLELTGFG